jgi:MFS family permease
VVATLLVVAWSQVHGLVAFYLVWAGLGLVMAAILYEPAFVVLAKWFPQPDERRRAMTALTLVAALASFIFLPLSQALIAAHAGATRCSSSPASWPPSPSRCTR